MLSRRGGQFGQDNNDCMARTIYTLTGDKSLYEKTKVLNRERGDKGLSVKVVNQEILKPHGLELVYVVLTNSEIDSLLKNRKFTKETLAVVFPGHVEAMVDGEFPNNDDDDLDQLIGGFTAAAGNFVPFKSNDMGFFQMRKVDDSRFLPFH